MTAAEGGEFGLLDQPLPASKKGVVQRSLLSFVARALKQANLRIQSARQTHSIPVAAYQRFDVLDVSISSADSYAGVFTAIIVAKLTKTVITASKPARRHEECSLRHLPLVRSTIRSRISRCLPNAAFHAANFGGHPRANCVTEPWPDVCDGF